MRTIRIRIAVKILIIKIPEKIMLKRVNRVEKLLTRKVRKKKFIDKDKNEKNSLFKNISEVECFNCGELDYYTKKYPNLRKKKLKKRISPVIVAAVILNKDFLTVKGTRCILIEVILYFSHGNRKITTLLNYKIDENLISQRFTKKNNLEVTSVEHMGITVDSHYIIIYKSHNIITKAKDSRNEVRATQRTFYATDI